MKNSVKNIVQYRTKEILKNPELFFIPNEITYISLIEEIEEISLSEEEELELFKASLKVARVMNQLIFSKDELFARFKAVVMLNQLTYENKLSSIIIYDLNKTEQFEFELGITEFEHLKTVMGLIIEENYIECPVMEFINQSCESYEHGFRTIEFSKSIIKLLKSVDVISKPSSSNKIFQPEYIVNNTLIEIYYNSKMKKYFAMDGFNIVVTPKL